MYANTDTCIESWRNKKTKNFWIKKEGGKRELQAEGPCKWSGILNFMATSMPFLSLSTPPILFEFFLLT